MRKVASWRAAADALPPAVYDSGDICLDILQNKWSPEYDTTSVLTSIQVRGTHRRRA